MLAAIDPAPVRTCKGDRRRVDDRYERFEVLQNEGIDAEVFDDSAYGGALGAIKNSVRIVVPDEQLEQAREALKGYELGDDVEG